MGRAFVLACIAVAAVSADADADAYTFAQVNAGIPALKTAYDGQTRHITGVSYGNGLVSGHLGYAGHGYAAYPYTTYGAAYAAPVHHTYAPYAAHVGYTGYTGYTGFHAIGKRDADADAYTIGRVAAGLPYANAVATGHAHNPGHIAYTSFPSRSVYNTYAPFTTYGYGLNGVHYG